MITTAAAALELLAATGRLPLSGAGSLVEAIAGKVRGSWWAHPRGKLIFKIASALHEHQDVVAAKLDGRVQFVHRRLWPALLRLATDEHRRAAAISALDREARRLLAEVERRGIIRITSSLAPKASECSGKLPSKARKPLEDALLLRADQAHTDEGHHEAELESWSHWARRAGVKAAGTVEEALTIFCRSSPSTPARRTRSPSPPRRRRPRSPP